MAVFVARLLTPGVTAHLPDGWRGDYGVERAAAWIAARDREGTQLLARTVESGEAIGLLVLGEEESPESPTLRVGYLIQESAKGQGYATELLEGLIDWARRSTYGRVVAGVNRSNTASIRVLEKCGFVRSVEQSAGTELFYSTRV